MRMPSAEEWEHLAKSVLPEKPDPIFTEPSLAWASAYVLAETTPRALKPRGSFSQTSHGISDLDGSVWEWTSTCHDAEWSDRCFAYVAAGLHMSVLTAFTRDPARGGCAVGAPPAHLGLRLVSDRKPPKSLQG